MHNIKYEHHMCKTNITHLDHCVCLRDALLATVRM